ncbi:MAG: hypothetical protein GX130_07055 [Candidatus Hydrogenedens sp.]|nr:hypothetical protein [Candidatus Hydrogenedens sp.]
MRISAFMLVLSCLVLVSQVWAEGPVKNWHDEAFFGLHYDLHPGAGDTELGRLTSYEHIRAMLEKVQPDFVQYDCKGHPGYSGYPSQVGSPSPGIVQDALRIWRDVTRDMGIPLSIHYSGVWDSRAIELHPEWARINEKDQPDPNYTSRLSSYGEELLIPQLLEVVREYDIDGMWIDGENWASHPDWSEACQKAFTEETGITEIPRKSEDPHWLEWLAFHRGLFEKHVQAYVDAVHELKPECMVTSNWMYSVRQPEEMTVSIDYLSGDFDPSFGSKRAMAEGRFMSTRGKPWDLMAWSFLQTKDQGWTAKPSVHLCQEVSTVLAQGGAVFIYDQPQRSGKINEWRQDILAEVARFCRQRQEFSHRTTTIPQVAILHSENSYYHYNSPLYNFGSANYALEGAMYAFLEKGYSVDLLNEATLLTRLSDYPLVVIPEARHVGQAFKDALPGYVEQGGRLLLSGSQVALQYGALAGVRQGEGHGTGWLPVDNGAVRTSAHFQRTELAGALCLSTVMTEQEPPEEEEDPLSAATLHSVGEGRVAAIYGDIFTNFFHCRYPGLRHFIGDTVEALETENLIRSQTPWFVEMAAREKDGRKLIHFVNRSVGGYLSPNRHIVESVPDTGSFSITIPLSEKPKRCYMTPDPVGLDWSWRDGVLQANIGGLHIHNILVIE